jgi:hypothetical protein
MVTYLGWLALLMSALISGNGVQSAVGPFATPIEWGLGLAGLVMMAIALWAAPRALANTLPRQTR